MVSNDRRQPVPRGPGVMFAAVTLVLLVLLAILSLTTRQPPPPSIAEFAPQAQTKIDDSPDDQSSSSGTAGGSADGLAAPSPTPPAGVQEVPRVRRCVGDPPRQIEDPQSPPCVPFWQGNNGGATFRGVTRDEIRVVAVANNSDAEAGARVLRALTRFFNTRFELYGRQVKFEPPKAPKGGGSGCEGRKAEVLAIVDENKAFAALGPGGNQVPCFLQEAARLKLLVVDGGAFMAEPDMRSGRPYLWQYGTANDEIFASWGRWICKRQAGKNAEYATDVRMRSQRRKFGLIVQMHQTPWPVDTSPMSNELAKCGEKLAYTDVAYSNDGQANDFRSQTMNAVVKMSAEGVTTVLTRPGGLSAPYLPAAATGQNYYPEWGLTGMGSNSLIEAIWPAAQRQSLVGFITEPEQVPYPHVAMNWALAETDNGYQSNRTGLQLRQDLGLYWNMLLLFSGIQLAGPALTPATFERGLQRAIFPNPTTPPLQEGWVGFSGDRHSMIHDSVPAWWSDAGVSPYPDEGNGAWCYAEGGRRYKLEEFTQGPDHLFEDVCHSSPEGL